MNDTILAAVCDSCGAISYPKHAVCPKCGHGRFADAEIGGEGTVLTYTDVYALAVDYETRYLRLAIVEFDNGVRATGHLLDEAPQLGKRVRSQVGVVRQSGDTKTEGLQFVPV